MYTLNLSSIVEQTPQQQLDSQPAVVLGKEEQNSGGEGHCKDEQQNYVEHMHDQQRELEPPNVDQTNGPESPVSALTPPISVSTSSTTQTINLPHDKEGVKGDSHLLVENTETGE